MAAAVSSSARINIGTILHDLRKSVDDFIAEEMQQINSPTSLPFEAACSVVVAIENARNIWLYEGLLTKHVEELSGIRQEKLNRLRTMATIELRSNNSCTLEDLPWRVKQFIFYLTGYCWMPKLTKVFPPYVKIGTQISFSGAFEYPAANPTFGYFITIAQSTCTKLKATRKALTVQLDSLNMPMTGKCQFIPAQLHVQYRPVGRVRSAIYNIWMGVQSSQ